MRGRAFIIRPESTEATIETRELSSVPTLRELQELIEGYIEVVPFFTRFVSSQGVHECVAFCNEEGKLLGLPINPVAVAMWTQSVPEFHGDPLVGTIVVLTGDQEFFASL